MQRVIPITTNINSDLYAFLRAVIYEERGGPAWYVLFLAWFVSMMTISMVVLSFIFTLDSGVVPGTIGGSLVYSESVIKILIDCMIFFMKVSIAYCGIGFFTDCLWLPIYDWEKDEL